MKSRRLLRRPRPYPDESLTGYIIRLTEANYYSAPQWIFQLSGLRSRGAYANIFNHQIDDLSRLSHICAVEVGTLWSMAFPANTLTHTKVVRQVEIFGHVVPTEALNRQQSQLCPVCLREKAYCRLFWEFSVVSACPFHHCLLIDSCPQCQHPIHWSRPQVAICPCQFDWRSFQPQIVESEQITLSSLIYKLCQLSGSPLENNFPVFLDDPVTQLNLGSLVNLLVSLSRFCRLPGIKHQVFPLKEANLGFSLNSASEFERVFALLKNWPTNFCQLMDGYEIYLGYEPAIQYVSGLSFPNIVDFFASIFIWFARESWDFLQKIFAAYFERFLKKVSIKNIQISFYRASRFCSVCISLNSKTSLLEKLASRPELEGLTLAKLFATSRIDWSNDTLFFRMIYFPD